MIRAGTRLGSYEILGPIGAGGMGEVWRARDTKLSREVAIKVIQAEVASDRERLKRFEKEARAASSLNHPGIVTVYDIGEADGTAYIAMELVEGATLREMVSQGALPIRKVLQIGAQVADALAKAHAAGIVHRDIKPENVMVTKDGFAKILDFGLAKLTRAEDKESSGATQTPTLTAATEPGIVMGTVGYMSPEQALGRNLDFRSDQFSFGAVLYELTTGERAFRGASSPEVLTAIIREEPPPLSSLNPKAPAPLVWIVERCLAKEPRERYASSDDLARDLATLRDRLSEASVSGAATVAEPAPRRRLALRLAAAAAFLVAGLAVAFLLGRQAGQRPHPTFKRLTFRHGEVTHAAFAPDGQTAVYSAAWEGKPPRIYSTASSLPLETPSAQLRSISRSGELAILMDGTLASVPIGGGGPRGILEGADFADWAPDGGSLAVSHRVGGRSRLEYPIGKVLYETTGGITQLCVSPDGERVAFFDHPLPWSNRGAVAVVDRQGAKRILTDGWDQLQSIVWPRPGDEIWFTGRRAGTTLGEIHSVSLSGRRRTVLRIAGLMGVEDVARDRRALVTLYTCHQGITGVAPGEMAERDLSWLDASRPRDISSDGAMLLLSETGDGSTSAEGDVYVRRMDGSPAVRIGEGEPRSFSPDGKWVVSVVGSSPSKLELLPTGPGEKRVLERGPITRYAFVAWSPDGRRVIFTGWEEGKASRVYVQDVAAGAPRPMTPEGVRATLAVAPDGRILARDAAGRYELVSPDGGAASPVSGIDPKETAIRFTADGRGLYLERFDDQPPSARVERLDLSTVRRELIKEVKPADAAGIESLGEFRLTADGKAYAYGYYRCQGDLYLVEGLR